MKFLELKNISFSYNGKEKVLKNISFSVKERSFTAIAGPNGAGKTTLLKIIGGILKPDQGEIILKNENIKNYSVKGIAKIISYVPQEPRFFLNLPVGYIVVSGRNPYLGLGERYKKLDYTVAREKMKLLGIEKLFYKRIFEISSGERKLVVIARALVQDTPLLLLDEPTNHLDIHHRIFILELLKKLKDTKTILMVSHSLNEILLFCDDTIIIHEGKIEKQGAPEKIVTKRLIKKVWKVDTEFITHPTKNKKQMIIIG